MQIYSPEFKNLTADRARMIQDGTIMAAQSKEYADIIKLMVLRSVYIAASRGKSFCAHIYKSTELIHLSDYQKKAIGEDLYEELVNLGYHDIQVRFENVNRIFSIFDVCLVHIFCSWSEK